MCLIEKYFIINSRTILINTKKKIIINHFIERFFQKDFWKKKKQLVSNIFLTPWQINEDWISQVARYTHEWKKTFFKSKHVFFSLLKKIHDG